MIEVFFAGPTCSNLPRKVTEKPSVSYEAHNNLISTNTNCDDGKFNTNGEKNNWYICYKLRNLKIKRIPRKLERIYRMEHLSFYTTKLL